MTDSETAPSPFALGDAVTWTHISGSVNKPSFSVRRGVISVIGSSAAKVKLPKGGVVVVALSSLRHAAERTELTEMLGPRTPPTSAYDDPQHDMKMRRYVENVLNPALNASGRLPIGWDELSGVARNMWTPMAAAWISQFGEPPAEPRNFTDADSGRL